MVSKISVPLLQMVGENSVLLLPMVGEISVLLLPLVGENSVTLLQMVGGNQCTVIANGLFDVPYPFVGPGAQNLYKGTVVCARTLRVNCYLDGGFKFPGVIIDGRLQQSQHEVLEPARDFRHQLRTQVL
ncbi:hypothetical protein MAR_037781 [Mya arenaria]|uniref:Uncharacterized protein n=1 Tax=Mya arenaria TaxID=6604 RepID=A0ABY7FPQ2_MYAAR|nr:hypothetical protein MAR_037781 [Mya arenaria]